MADGSIVKRVLRIVFDRQSADQANAQLNDSLGKAGKAGGGAFLKELKAAFDKSIADLKVQLAKGLIDPKQFRQMADQAAQQYNAGIVAGLEKAQAAGTLTNAEYLKLTRTIKTVGDAGQGLGDQFSAGLLKVGSWFAGLFAFQRIATFIESVVKAGADAQQSIAGLTDALGKVGISYSQVKPRVDAALTSVRGFSATDVRQSLTNLITITGDYTKSLGLLSLTADVATKRQSSMAEAADVVGKASLGLAKGLGDLGIRTGETGDLITKLRANIGGLNDRESQTFAGRIRSINVLWDDFKEKIGLAVIGSNNLSGSASRLQRALIDLNTWAEKNSGAIGSFIDKLVTAGTALAKVSNFIINHTPNLYTLSKAYDWLTGKTKDNATATVAANDAVTASNVTRRLLTADEQRALLKLMGDGSGERVALTVREAALIDQIYKDEGAGRLTLTKEQDAAIAAFRKERTAAAAEAAKNAQRTFTEIQQLGEADRLKTIDDNMRAILADRDKYDKLILQLETDAGKSRNAALAAELTEAKRLRDVASAQIAASQITPNVVQTPGTNPLVLPAGDIAPDNSADIHAAAVKDSTAFLTPWQRALAIIDAEANKEKGLFAELGQSWAEGGLAGVAKWAKTKVIENVASAIEETAKGFGVLELDPVGAEHHFKSAAGHTLAAAEWGVLAGVAGAASSIGASGGGGTGAGGSSSTDSASSAEAPSQEVNIYLSGEFDALNPKIQQVIYTAQQQAKERFGDNAHVRIIRSIGR